MTTGIGTRTELHTPRHVRVPLGALSQAMRAMRQNGSPVIAVQRHARDLIASGAEQTPERTMERTAKTEAKPRRRSRKKQG
ncbi:hypothetical protein [Synechococcus sp. W4D4]|uniref:hypothetical protein n=1 Tax=Synechococcus sp. W4D4 TaxID=3392294 RepID=UPI0039EA7A35